MEPNGPSSSNLALQAKFLKSKKIKDFGLYLSNIGLTYNVRQYFSYLFRGPLQNWAKEDHPMSIIGLLHRVGRDGSDKTTHQS